MTDVKNRIAAAAEEFDARELAEAFREADELGVPQSEYQEEHALYMNLQDGDFIYRIVCSVDVAEKSSRPPLKIKSALPPPKKNPNTPPP